MKTMKKIVAIMAAALMLCSILPLSVMAADGYIKADSISVGDTVVLVCESKSMELSGISTSSTKYGVGEKYTDAPAGAYPLEVVAGSTSGTYAFKTSDDNYLCWTSGNSLNVATTLSDNTSWTVTFKDGNAVILNAKDSTRKLQWNASSPRFACYTSNQTAVQLYKQSAGSDKPDCEHEWDNDCDTDCNLNCGYTREIKHDYECVKTVDATCTEAGEYTYECAVCGHSYDEEIPTIAHNYVDGQCSECGAEEPLEATITFDADKTQRTEFGTESQKWENNGLVLINNKGTGNPIADYSNPIRMYKGSEIIISFPGMTSLVIDATGIGSDHLWNATLDGYTFTVEGGIYTVTFAEPVDSITLTAANQVRANSITACGSSKEEETSPISFGGNSVSEDVSGLAFKFDVAVEGMAVNGTTAIYDNATVNGYKLVKMGAVVSNSKSSKDIEAVYLCALDETSASYAVRIINIPNDKYDVEITAVPYIVVEIDGVETTIEGEAQTATYNGVLG